MFFFYVSAMETMGSFPVSVPSMLGVPGGRSIVVSPPASWKSSSPAYTDWPVIPTRFAHECELRGNGAAKEPFSLVGPFLRSSALRASTTPRSSSSSQLENLLLESDPDASRNLASPRRAVAGMHGTTIERALLDACASYPAAMVGKAMDDALRRRLTTVTRLRASIPTDPRGIRGARAFLKLVRGRDLNDQEVRSEMETRMLRILRRIKHHDLVANHEVLGAKKYFLDFAFPRAFLGIECHSRRWHGPGRLNADLARHRHLQRLGWTILYYTWDDVVFRADEVLAEIEDFLREATARSGASLPI